MRDLSEADYRALADFRHQLRRFVAFSESAARAIEQRAIGSGLNPGVLYGSNFGSLRPGYWVVFSGVYATQSDAARSAARARNLALPTPTLASSRRRPNR